MCVEHTIINLQTKNIFGTNIIFGTNLAPTWHQQGGTNFSHSPLLFSIVIIEENGIIFIGNLWKYYK